MVIKKLMMPKISATTARTLAGLVVIPSVVRPDMADGIGAAIGG